MKNSYLACTLALALFAASCKSDKKSDAEADTSSTPAAVEESPYKEAAFTDLIGEFADPNYPDGEFWKTFTVKFIAGEKVEITFASKPMEGLPGCRFRGTGDYRNGYLQIPVNPSSTDPTFLTVRLMKNGDYFVGAEGGGQENPSDVLGLFCQTRTPNTLGGIYNKVN